MPSASPPDHSRPARRRLAPIALPLAALLVFALGAAVALADEPAGVLGERFPQQLAALRRVFLPAVFKPAPPPPPTPTRTPTRGPAPTPIPTATPTPLPEPSIAYGVNQASAEGLPITKQMGMRWIKGFANWSEMERSRGQINWQSLDFLVGQAQQQGFRMLVRVDRVPEWASGSANTTTPPRNPDDFGNFAEQLATRYRGRIHVYEIWNEPNLNYEFGDQRPDPARFVGILKAVYPRIKRADPNAVVIAGALSTSGDRDDAGVIGDLIYLQRMYNAGVKGSFDAMGTHPYGGPNSPDTPTAPGGLVFNRAKEQHDVMLANGDESPMWATEFGWVANTPCDLGYFNQFKISEDLQAQYLVRAFEKARTEWPWMKGMFIFNVDFGIVPWYPECRFERFFSIAHRATPGSGPILYRPAFEALKNMPKP